MRDEVYLNSEDDFNTARRPSMVHRETVRATSAMLTNIVAGSLAGAATRRFTSKALYCAGAGAVVTQLLVIAGYAEVRWRELFADLFDLIFHGVPISEAAQATNVLTYYWYRFLTTLTATIPRRLSFWAGVAGGTLFL